ncbi:MAG TPA: histidine kinase, partial [Gemmatimonadaceae bacterium]|nr:histidine kinase [Gemmatimonadaceae bacterium]
LKPAAVILGLWTLVGVVTTQLQYYAMAKTGHAQPWGRLFLSSLPSIWLWALYTPAILWLGRRYRVERDTWMRSIPVHLAAGALLTLADVVLMHALPTWFDLPGTVRAPVHVVFARVFFLYMLCYVAIAAFAQVRYYAALSQQRQLRAAHLESQLTAARLTALQSQLRPHFLFNTLNMIAEQVYTDPAGADAMITRLGVLLRSSFALHDAQEVELREELELLRCYLDIMRQRFHDRLTIEIDVHPNALDALVPHLLLQPLVENALRHGIERREAGGILQITAHPHLDTLDIEVRDNGPGMGPSVRQEGTGIRNTRDRLEHLYGTAQRFALRERPGGGTIAAVTIPYRRTVVPPGKQDAIAVAIARAASRNGHAPEPARSGKVERWA